MAAGCNTKVAPVGTYPAPATSGSNSLVANFEGNQDPTPEPTNQTNAHLFELGVPNDVVVSPGLWNVINNFPANEAAIMTIKGPGASGTALACNISGSVTDQGNGAYPAIELEGYMDASSPFPYKAYNAGFFTGVQFYINIASDDTALVRYFYVPTTQEAEPPDGSCTQTTGCYNYFGYTFHAPTNGWVQENFTFKNNLGTSYGVEPVPPTLTGINLQQVLGLLWEEGRANTIGVSKVDFSVDEIYFY
jgi:hypothetical protein